MKCFYISDTVYKGLGVTKRRYPALIVGGNLIKVIPLKRMTVSDVRIVEEAVVKQRRGKFVIQEAYEPSPGVILHVNGVKDFRPVRNCLVIEYVQESVLFALYDEGKVYMTVGQDNLTLTVIGRRVMVDRVSPSGIETGRVLESLLTEE